LGAFELQPIDNKENQMSHLEQGVRFLNRSLGILSTPDTKRVGREEQFLLCRCSYTKGGVDSPSRLGLLLPPKGGG